MQCVALIVLQCVAVLHVIVYLALSHASSSPPSPASDLVDCVIRMREVSDRESAVALGQLLVDTDYIHHVVDEHSFEDGFLFFRFRQDG